MNLQFTVNKSTYVQAIRRGRRKREKKKTPNTAIFERATAMDEDSKTSNAVGTNADTIYGRVVIMVGCGVYRTTSLRYQSTEMCAFKSIGEDPVGAPIQYLGMISYTIEMFSDRVRSFAYLPCCGCVILN